MKIKIVYLILNGTNYGGSEKHTLDLINNISEDQYDVYLICTKGNPIIDSVKPTLKSNCYPMERGLSNFFKITRLIRELNPDILHLQAARGIVTGRYATLINRFYFRSNYKIISTTHGWVLPHFKIVKLMEWLFLSFRNLDEITIAVSRQSRKELIEKGFNSNKVRTVYNGIDLNLFDENRNVRNRILNIGFVGRLSHQKGIYYLLDTIKAFRNSEYQFHIYGDGEYKNLITESIKSSNSNNVKYHGFINSNNIGEAYSNIDILFAPSIDEGLPYTFIEAMNCGIPVLSTTVGGVPEIIDHDLNGWLIEPKSVDSLIAKLKEIKNIDISHFSEQAICKSYQFSLENMINQTTDLYKSIYSQLNITGDYKHEEKAK